MHGLVLNILCYGTSACPYNYDYIFKQLKHKPIDSNFNFRCNCGQACCSVHDVAAKIIIIIIIIESVDSISRDGPDMPYI